ncbi:hypothetical protein [Kitasatospora brasiliensis]|uniref:hypothetical protein n=1 Tax=Kitasatospora brasiliensis TaxID=3058040 RepID=UPI00293195C3|nr:hypothetical protein [Kitasatospora sp. K002]
MTLGTDPPVYTQATRAPWREILWHRLSGRRDRALVLGDRHGLYHQLGKGRRRLAGLGEEGGVAARLGLRGFDQAFLVDLAERPGERVIGLRTPYGRETLEVHFLWWVHDAARVVQTRTSRGELPVRKDLDARLGQLKEQSAAAGTRLGPEELVHYLAAPYVLPHYGLGYRVTDVSARERGNELRLGEPDSTDVPFDWSVKSEEEYAFCRRYVQDGPVALAALWLARKPDEVRDVLDWVVNHADLLRGETTWQDKMALMLGRLTEPEQEELSTVLRDRLVALGRQVPGPAQQSPQPPHPPGPGFTKFHPHVNGWSGGVPNGVPR